MQDRLSIISGWIMDEELTIVRLVSAPRSLKTEHGGGVIVGKVHTEGLASKR
jgi:hypothetical protein